MINTEITIRICHFLLVSKNKMCCNSSLWFVALSSLTEQGEIHKGGRDPDQQLNKTAADAVY